MAARTWRNAGEHKATEAGWRMACFNPVLPSIARPEQSASPTACPGSALQGRRVSRLARPLATRTARPHSLNSNSRGGVYYQGCFTRQHAKLAGRCRPVINNHRISDANIRNTDLIHARYVS